MEHEKSLFILRVRSRIEELENKFIAKDQRNKNIEQKWKVILTSKDLCYTSNIELIEFRKGATVNWNNWNFYGYFSDKAAHKIMLPVNYDIESIIKMFQDLGLFQIWWKYVQSRQYWIQSHYPHFLSDICLEILSDLSTARFLECIQRFISRRGIHAQVTTDNATNFQDARNFFIDNTEKFTLFAPKENFIRQFIPPRAPHHGGIWEAGIWSAKTLPLKSTKGVTLTFEEYNSLFTSIEAVKNSRPLAYAEHISQDAEILTPGHFHIGRPFTSVPLLDADDTKQVKLPKRLELIRNSSNSFWCTWSKTYLNQLQLRHKWQPTTKNLVVGRVVLVKEDTPQFQWPLGVIEATYPGPDKLVGIVKVRI